MGQLQRTPSALVSDDVGLREACHQAPGAVESKSMRGLAESGLACRVHLSHQSTHHTQGKEGRGALETSERALMSAAWRVGSS